MVPILGATSSQALWFASRGTGIVCLLLLTASVVLGVVTTVRFETRHWPRFVIERLHRNVSMLILVFLVIHVATTVIDGFVPIGFLDAVVPFRSPYRTWWVGLGAVAFDLLLALVISSIVRARIGYRVWRAVHWAAYACWPIALIHGLGTGSDTRQGWMVLLDLIALGAVCAAVSWRLAVSWRPGSRVRWGAVAALVLLPLGVGVWTLLGPLQPGWARPKPSAAERAATAEPESAGFSAAVAGSRTVSKPANASMTTVSIRGAVAGPLRLQLDLELVGRAEAQGVTLSTGRIALGPRGATSRWSGRVLRLNGGAVEAQVADRYAHGLIVDLNLHVGPAGHAFTGTIAARATSVASTSGSS